MFFTDKEKGLRTLIKMRYGLAGYPDWRGINKQSDRGAIDRNQFVELVNLRNSGGSWDVRGGTSAPVNTIAFTGCVTGLVDLGGEIPLPILVAGGTDSLSPYGIDRLTVYNYLAYTAEAETSPLDLPNTTQEGQPIVLHNGKFYTSDFNGALNTFGLSLLNIPDSSVEPLYQARSITRVVDVPAEPYSLCSAFGKIWITTQTGSAYSWDGTTLTEILTSIPAGPCYIWSYNESIYITAEELFGRYNSDGSWTFFALPTHTGGIFYPRCITECPTVNKLYFGGYTYYATPLPVDGGVYTNNYFCTLYAFDGVSVTEVFGVSTSTDNLLSCSTVDTTGLFIDSGVSAVVEFNGAACFMYMLLMNGGEQSIGLIGSLASLQAVQIGDNNVGLDPVVTCLFVDSNNQLYAGINVNFGQADANDVNRIIRMDNATLSGYWHTAADKSGWTNIGGTSWSSADAAFGPPIQILSAL